ncbi:urate hydroxylase PuuD [Methylococcus sp. EFPC2]|uniref:urate hydroxylase PuuD n=1 Tax=Methylococcus sp. EFPC2 TaxID=2812648 RepID=UPI001967ECC7|nr:urate hydroxylase PuuD [Methylococcus sp. EFPC2]QSA95763.1 urate hydroxylase PuuD [Methylococcus sp. EFPC2]
MRSVIIKLIESLGKFGLDKLERALIFGAILVTLLAFVTGSIQLNLSWASFFFRWLHVISGVMWIGLLWYFNFVQIPSMPKIPDEQKPAIGKVIAPTALFWFRWAALSTLVTGLIVATLQGYVVQALLLGLLKGGSTTYIGVGMWLGLIMAYNVWMIIWPNQKKALGLVEATDDEKKAAARIAMLTSRFNTALSIPMLYFMVAAQNAG